MKILVTGARGMLGSRLASTLIEGTEHELVLWDRSSVDLLSESSVRQGLAAVKPDLILHAAARVGGIQANIKYPVEFLSENIRLDSNLILAAHAEDVNDFLYIGSSCMYPKDFSQPLMERDILAGSLEPTNEGYALAKIVGSRLCESFEHQYQRNYKTVVLSNLYGPGDSFDPFKSHLVAACLYKVHEAKMNKSKSLSVWGNGMARREFTFVDDVAKWVSEHIENFPELPSYLNLGYGRDFTINEFYAQAMLAVGYDVELQHDLEKPVGMLQKLMDSTLARSSHGWSPTTNLEEGMRKTYEHFLKTR